MTLRLRWESIKFKLLRKISVRFRNLSDRDMDMVSLKAEVSRLKVEVDIEKDKRIKAGAKLEKVHLESQSLIQKTMDLQWKLDESMRREADARAEHVKDLRATANYSVMAAGSRLPIFDGAGPTRPEPTEAPKAVNFSSRQRARLVINEHNKKFMQEFQEAQLAEARRWAESDAPQDPAV